MATYELTLCIPITKEIKARIDREAAMEERKAADMGRVLWREALDARDDKRARQKSSKQGTAAR